MTLHRLAYSNNGLISAELVLNPDSYCAHHLDLTWGDGNRIAIYEANLLRLRDLLNAHFPPPAKKASKQTHNEHGGSTNGTSRQD